METAKYVYWQDENMWLGYLEAYPDYWTQGETTEELEENLRDIYLELVKSVSTCSSPQGDQRALGETYHQDARR